MRNKVLTYEDFKANVLDAFIDGYKLGRDCAEKAFGKPKMKVDVNVVEPVDEFGNRTDGRIEIVRLVDGGLHNVGGRSMPF